MDHLVESFIDIDEIIFYMQWLHLDGFLLISGSTPTLGMLSPIITYPPGRNALRGDAQKRPENEEYTDATLETQEEQCNAGPNDTV